MNFGVPKEVRAYEQRVGLTPAGVYALVKADHIVYVEHEAGLAAGFSDEDYRAVGANVLYSSEEVYGRAETILKVSRITQDEYPLLVENQCLLSFMHLAVASKDLLEALKAYSITAIAYETIQNEDGKLPVLEPTSQVVGRLAPILAGQMLQSRFEGRGILISGIPGVPAAEVVILGAGVVGTNAAQAFLGLGAHVTILDNDYQKLEEIDEKLQGRVNTIISSNYNLNRVLRFADVVVGAVLVPGKRTPVLLTREMLRQMRPRAVFIDFSIDQGGTSETSRPTTHYDPIYIEEDVIHFAVPNVPARVGRTASHALTNAALPFIRQIGASGVEGALEGNQSLKQGLQVLKGHYQK